MSDGGAPAGLRAGPIAVGTGAGESADGRSLVRLLTFAALGLYGILRWATLLRHPPTWRLLALLALALVLSGVVTALRPRHRPAALLCSAIAVLAILPLAGIPLQWVLEVRVAVIVRAVGEGLSALPGVLLPYLGADAPIRIVIVLGAAVLLLDAALLCGFAPGGRGEVGRMAAALPLLALAVVPSTLSRPQLPYLQGAVLLGLLLAFVWGERIDRDRLPSALALAGCAAVLALVAAPALDPHRPWLNYEALAGTVASPGTERFDWSQRYGPLRWPQTGREVLEVRAVRPEYWKTEDLDVFDGQGWVRGSGVPTVPLAPADRSARARWTQTLRVRIRGMRSTDVIAAGLAARPTRLSGSLLAGSSPGTWRTATPLAPGDSYLVRAYAPHPTSAQLGAIARSELTAAAHEQSEQLSSYLSVPFARLRYAPALALARRLARRAPTPYAYVIAVERHLARGFTYDENPPPSRYPLESFLLDSRRGYCQQFAGAMALLLRMGGVPARVAVGFTTGSYAPGHRWLVSDIDAHAWVEAWFPHYGWVRFDPTPAAAPARGGATPALPSRGAGQPDAVAAQHAHRRVPIPRTTAAPAHPHAGSRAADPLLPSAVAAIAVMAMLAMVVGIWRQTRYRDAGDIDALVAELERALARCGAPLEPGVTLAVLEQRWSASPQAGAYLAALRLARFGTGGELPSRGGRRALRRWLRVGLGPIGPLQVLWALPPRLPRRGGKDQLALARARERA
ncbi:MAG: transglutaminase domain-containing protein [Solirubrobacteraceae bacterium]